MSEIQKAVNLLRELSDGVTPVAMIGLEKTGFEPPLAVMHGTINSYSGQRFQLEGPRIFLDSQTRENDESFEVIRLGTQLLARILDHHVSREFPASQDVVYMFHEVAKQIFDLMNTYFNVNQQEYDKAQLASLRLRAVMACGITPPFYPEPIFNRHNDPSNKSMDAEALKYATDNIVEFTRFVFNLAANQRFIPEPLGIGQRAEVFKFFIQLKGLAFPSGIPITHQ
ncbi:hypothetical protein [Paraburkholderia adhaesiva]|uniref:hypothetical protein n=1 Tax=Paraburkholderia adhaesiva TaxID=2883244 RepID=UPI001F2F99FD|nr:hypothetical protein [Paraburkholderia adhaesiva]